MGHTLIILQAPRCGRRSYYADRNGATVHESRTNEPTVASRKFGKCSRSAVSRTSLARLRASLCHGRACACVRSLNLACRFAGRNYDAGGTPKRRGAAWRVARRGAALHGACASVTAVVGAAAAACSSDATPCAAVVAPRALNSVAEMCR